jgi:protein-disulfide isomerase
LIISEYVDTGKVYYIYRDLPLAQIHPGAIQAAHAANCAAEQGAFWQMNDRLYLGQFQREWGSGGPNDAEVFVAYGQALGIDPAALRSCMAEQRYAGQIETDLREAAGRGLNSTPSFVVNGQVFLGARPYSSWKQLFDSILQQL